MSPRVLILGASGQLGRELTRGAPSECEFFTPDRVAADLTRPESLATQFALAKPTVVINAAAYTAVDRAEAERDAAFGINETGAANVADLAATFGARMIHISTDFVFDGRAGSPYQPGDPTNPLNAYGASKLAGEGEVLVRAPGAVVVRTAWLYGNGGANFVQAILTRLRRNEPVRVVADQVGTPTWARSLASMLWRVVDVPAVSGVLHFTDAGVASWYDFAMAIEEEALALRLIPNPVGVSPIATEQYPTPARRPSYSVLDKRATWEHLALTPVHWRDCLRSMLSEWTPPTPL